MKSAVSPVCSHNQVRWLCELVLAHALQKKANHVAQDALAIIDFERDWEKVAECRGFLVSA